MSFGGRGASSLLASGLTALLALGILAAPATAAKAPRVGGCYVFPAFKGSPTAASAASQTAWNQDVSKAPVDPRSLHMRLRQSYYARNLRRFPK